MSGKIKGLLALLSTIFIWSLMTIIVKSAVSNADPIVLLFLRLLIAAVTFFPFILRSKVWTKPRFTTLAIISLLAAGNVFGFMMGVKYTSASVSQLIYAAIPIILLIVSSVFYKEKFSWQKVAGILIGFSGLIYIFYSSIMDKGETISGGITGNIIIFIAALNWAGYILFSKRISKYFSPMEIGGVSAIVSFICALIFIIFSFLFWETRLIFTPSLLGAAFYAGFFGTFVTYLLFQYAVKNLSSLTVGLSSYIQPITTSFLAILLIGEKLTASYAFGSILVLLGVFISTSDELRRRVNRK